ncbi:hypothetical protein [Delftia acidovorans]|jgi:hypothetical protein|uniref:hypothetical protein n=1 Tax=Delftia acidovorans TaxID=80866 RepID=UPI000A5DC5CD|nr:hypothetical protein [Delftia acidovorans]
MSVIAEIEARLASGNAFTIAQLGGAAAIAAEADALVKAPYLDVLVSLASSADTKDESVLDALVLRGFRESCNALPFRDAANAVVDSDALRMRISKELQPVLAQRVNERQGVADGLVAAYALEAMFRLALSGAISKYQTLGLMTELGPEKSGLFAEHAAKLTGAAFHIWGEQDLLRALDRLLTNEDAEGEAAFELGLAYLAQALEGDSLPEILEGLETARVFFSHARRADEDRADAVAYCSSIDLIRGFAAGAAADALRAPLETLMAAVADRARLLQMGVLPSWLKPRQDRDIQWARFLRTVECLAKDLERPSWLNAWAVMDRLLDVYDADRTICAGSGLDALFRPRIEATFARERGLLSHLDDLLCEPGWLEAHGEVSRTLRARIDELVKGAAASGKPKEGAPYPQLRRVLQDDQRVGEMPADFAERLEGLLDDRARRSEHIVHPVVQRILSDVRIAFTQCSDYNGIVRDDFDELVLQVVLFCKDRQDAGLKELGTRGAYLRDPSATEFQFQSDLREWLSGNFRRGDVRTEVEGVAAGRADIYVGFGTHRFIIELKRHHGMVNADVARQYLGQAGSYQGTNVKLGMLGVLELVNRGGPPASLEECIWYDAIVPSGTRVARHHVVFRVPGVLRSPSALSAKAGNFVGDSDSS